MSGPSGCIDDQSMKHFRATWIWHRGVQLRLYLMYTLQLVAGNVNIGAQFHYY